MCTTADLTAATIVRCSPRHGTRVRAAMVAALVVLVGPVAAPPPQPAGAAPVTTAVMRPARVDATEIGDWFRLRAPGGDRATVPVEQLVALFLDEGQAQGVAGDLAFVQSVLETGWFTFPADGAVQPDDNNFGGLGATGSTGDVARFPTARLGVRAQVQHLWAYADPAARPEDTARPLVDPRFDLVPKGSAPTWEQMGGGRWAADPAYGTKVLALHTDLLDSAHVRVERWVAAAFVDVLHRPVGPAGVDDWVSRAEVRGRGWVARTLTSSSEGVSTWVRGRYQQLLGRPPSAAALAQRTAQVRAGQPLVDLVAALAGSDEAWRRSGGTDAAWVDQLYRSLLGRPAEPAAVDHWGRALAAGTVARGTVVAAVWRSGEGRAARVTTLYLALLDRAPDPGGLTWWAGHLVGTDDLTATAELVAGTEHFAGAQA